MTIRPVVGLAGVCLILMIWIGFSGTTVLAEVPRQGSSTLVFGEPVTGTLDNERFRHVYAFDGLEGDIVTISMDRLGGDLDPYLLLTDEQGNILALSDDEGTEVNALISSKRLPLDGRYFVIATRYGQEHGSTTGQFSLLVEKVGAGPASTNTIRYGDNLLGQITSDTPLVFYFLRATRGDMIEVSMRRASGNLDPHVDLATVDGRILISNDDDPRAEGTLDAGFSGYTIPQTDLYLIVATRFGHESGDTTGTYLLSVTQVPPEDLGTSPEMARLVDYGDVVSGSIDADNPLRYYRFEGKRGDVVTIGLNTDSGTLNPLLKLVDAYLVTLVQDDDSGEQNNARIAAFTLPVDGEYYVVAARAGEAAGQTSGTYTLLLNGRPGIVGDQALEIVYGASVSGLIDDQNIAEEYVFFGQQGDVIRIKMERASGDLDSLVTLFDSDRKQIVFDDDGGGDQNALIDRFVLPADGMYLIVASRFDNETGTTNGAYLLSLDLVRAGS